MKKKLIILIVIVFCIGLGFIYMNNKSFKSIVITKSQNVPSYLVINRSGNDDPGVMNYDSNILVTNKTAQYPKLNEQFFNNVEYNPYNNTLNFISNFSCHVNVYYSDLNAKEYDLCKKTSSEAGIQELRFTNNYNIATLNGGFSDDMNGYQSGIGIYDKEFNLIAEIVRKNIVYSTTVENNNVYYLVSGEDVADEMSQKKSQIIQYNIKTRKEKIIYDIKGKNDIVEIIAYNNNIYVIYIDKKNYEYSIGILENGKIIKKDKIGYEYGSFSNYTINKDGDILVVFPTVVNENETEKSSLVKITKDGKIQVHNLVFPDAVLTAAEDYIYYKDSNEKYYRMDTVSLKKEEINLPFPSKLNQDYHFIDFFGK